MPEPTISLRDVRALPVLSETLPRGGRRLLVEITPAERDVLVEAVEAVAEWMLGHALLCRCPICVAFARFSDLGMEVSS